MGDNSVTAKYRITGKAETFAVFFISFLLITLKNSFHEVIYPILPAEDGRFLFQVFYNDHEFKSVFRLYSGYVSVLPNLLAYFLTGLPVKIIPSSFSLVALCITAATYSLFYPLAHKLYQDKLFAAYVVIIISILPLGNLWLVGALAYQSWNLTLILFLLYLLPMPQKPIPRIFYALLITLLIWSHPLCLLMIPLYLFKLLTRRARRFEHTLFCGSGILYGFAGMVPGEINFSEITSLFKVFMVRVVGEALAGPQNRMTWVQAGNNMAFISMLVLSVLVVATSIYLSRAKMEGGAKTTLVALTGFLFFSFIISITARVASRNLTEEFLLAQWGTQYVYISKILFVAILLFLSIPLLKKFAAFRYIHVALVFIVFFINSNSNAVYKTSVDNGEKVLQFVDILSRNQGRCREGSAGHITLKKGDIGTKEFPANFNIRIKVCNE